MFTSLTVLSVFFSPQLVVSLLFLTAIAGLAVTLGEDFGPSSDKSMTNFAVYYTNPVLFAITWVNFSCFFFIFTGVLKIYLLLIFKKKNWYVFLSDPSAAVPGSSEAARKNSRLHQSFSLLASSCSV